LVVAMMSLTVVFDRWLWEVDLLCRTLVGWFILRFPCGGRILGLQSTNRAGGTFPHVLRARPSWDWGTPWNVLLYGCASLDR